LKNKLVLALVPKSIREHIKKQMLLLKS